MPLHTCALYIRNCIDVQILLLVLLDCITTFLSELNLVNINYDLLLLDYNHQYCLTVIPSCSNNAQLTIFPNT